MPLTDKKFTRLWMGIVLVVWLAGVCLSCALESRQPSTDVFLFKEAGVNLALHGRLVAANLTHMNPDETLPYAYYPPLYPSLFGLWSTLWGVGLKQSIAFDALLRLLRTFMIFGLVYPWWRKSASNRYFMVGSALLFILLTALTSDGDRPDELAAVFGFGALWALRANKAFLTGVLLGLVGATSPAAGVFFASVVSLEHFRSRRPKPLVGIGMVALLVFVGCNLPVYLADPAAFVRFSKQAGISNFPYSLAGAGAFVESLSAALAHSWRSAGAYVVCAVLLAAGYFSRRSKETDPFLWALGVGSVAYMAMNVVVWTLQPYYLWFAILGLVAFSLIQERRASGTAMGMLVLALFPLALREAKGQLSAMQREQRQSAGFVAERVLSHLESGDTLAVASDQFFTFRPRLEVANVTYVCPYVERFDFVYVTPKSSRRDRKEVAPFPCHGKEACFSPVADLSAAPVFKVLGVETPFYVRGNGGILYQNTGACS